LIRIMKKPHVATFWRKIEAAAAAAASSIVSWCLIRIVRGIAFVAFRLLFCCCWRLSLLSGFELLFFSPGLVPAHPRSTLTHTRPSSAATRVEGCQFLACMCGVNAVFGVLVALLLWLAHHCHQHPPYSLPLPPSPDDDTYIYI